MHEVSSGSLGHFKEVQYCRVQDRSEDGEAVDHMLPCYAQLGMKELFQVQTSMLRVPAWKLHFILMQ